MLPAKLAKFALAPADISANTPLPYKTVSEAPVRSTTEMFPIPVIFAYVKLETFPPSPAI